jgi:hypothetical protein
VGPSSGLATGDASALADGPSPEHSDNTIDAAEAEREGLTVHDAMDPELGLTNIGDVPAQDWAADTGETKNAEMEKEEEPDEEASGSRE